MSIRYVRGRKVRVFKKGDIFISYYLFFLVNSYCNYLGYFLNCFRISFKDVIFGI